ncbi:MAG: hypothetical protein F6K34_19470, partial [Okeania sp. SIO4D6]|nr:hypothetical protein [Okeania sp. SIO4D6]
MVHSNGRGRWGDEDMRRWGVEKTVSRKETEIHPLSWSIGYGEVSSPSHPSGSCANDR